MRLYVNLIPALAYALVMMFSNMAGMTGEVVKPSGKQQVVSLPDRHPGLNLQDNYFSVSKNGQIILSSGYGNGNLQWKIPYTL